MALRKAKPVGFTPKGLTDAYDATQAFPGACRSLQNLVFDQANPEIVNCRPGVVQLTDFTGFTTPTFVTCFIAIGDMVYGMVSTGRNAGYDEPFAYSVSGNTFVAISNVLAGNVPLSPSSSTGTNWTPPSMTVVGTKILIAHAGFSGVGANFIGVIDISVPATPAWSSSNLATNALPSVPTVVANLNNRAYYVCGNVAYFSDVLVPLTRTNASQSLTLGDTTPILALSGLPVQTTSSGVVQALLAFKAFQIWQITGDLATTNLALNYLSLNVGTSAPRSVVQTPYGTNFSAIDGPYVVDPLGVVKPLTKSQRENEQDIQQPFINCRFPSRVSAGYSGGTYRISLDTIVDGQDVSYEYWFDLERRRWNGPHTFPQDCCAQMGNYFVISYRGQGAKLYKSELTSSATSVYTDAGSPVSFLLESSTFPKDGSMMEKMVVESTVELSTAGATVTYQVNAINDQRTVLNSTNISVQGSTALWGTAVWGAFTWGASINIPKVYTIPWTKPLVFQKMAIQITGMASSNISIGTFFARYQETGYTNMGS